MAKNKKKERMVIFLLIGVVLLMAIGFATYNATLNISGNVTVSPASWSVHYDNATYNETTGSVAATSHSLTNTDFEFTAALTKPGDFYEATFNVVNDGTIAAQLKTVTMSTLTTAQQKYLTYTVTYDNTPYTVTTSGLSTALAVNGTKTVKVRVEYILPNDANDLPQGSNPVNVTVTGNLYYEQVSN